MKPSHRLIVTLKSALAVAALCALHAGAMPAAQAQPQAQVKPAPHAPAQAQAAPAAPAAPAPAAPSAPVRTERITYDSWTVTCTDTLEKAAKKTCSAVLQVIEEKQHQVLMVWVIGRDNQGVLRTVFQSLTGVQIPKGVELKLGGTAMRTVPYTACTPQNCEASVAMDDAMVRDARASSEATATITLIDGRQVNFKMGIKGIDKAFAALGK